jgi:hypothetical protein
MISQARAQLAPAGCYRIVDDVEGPARISRCRVLLCLAGRIGVPSAIADPALRVAIQLV